MGFHRKREQLCSHPDEQCLRNLHAELHRMHLNKMHLKLHRHHHKAFQRYHRYFRYGRLAVVLFNIIIFYLLFSWVGIKAIGILFAVLVVIKEIIQFIFLVSLEKRIIKPIEQLKQGVDEIAKGNYNVTVECDMPNDLGLLIASFNEMAQKLVESERLKAEYEENRKALIANVSHDLKTPITAMQGYLEALLDGTVKPSESQEKYLKTIYHNTVYINKLIDDLFLFSKLDMQKLEFHFETVQIQDFMDDVMEEYQFDFEEREIQFQYIAQLEHNDYINLDRKRFYQAFNNIISNAVKHGPENNLSIQVKLYQQDNFICIAIQDNGPGIPADKLPFIFDRFYRIDTERTKDFVSTGLGLAIARELVEAHGGRITVSSKESEGTRFTIMLPVSHDTEGEGY